MTSQRNEILIVARKHCNLFQEQVANAVGVSVRHYRKIEAGKCKPNVETAISIADLLGCDVSDLFAPRRQPRDANTQPDYSNKGQSRVEAAKELETAHKNFTMNVAIIADIIEDGRLDCPEHREMAEQLRDKLDQILKGKAA